MKNIILKNRKKEPISLNNLNGKEWVKTTKTVWHNLTDIKNFTFIENAIETGVLFSESPPRDELKKLHPATFSENDVAKLIRFFTKEKETVLDPFLGSGSSAIASIKENRNFIGIELYEEWFNIAQERVSNSKNLFNSQVDIKVYCNDSYEILKSINDNSIDFIVTSPPYWGILDKIDHKAKQRIKNNFKTNYGKHNYDLSNIEKYSDFIQALKMHFKEYYRVLKTKKYLSIIVSDFRHKQKYYMFHADIANALEDVGFIIQGLIVLVQDNKKLYPYGFPTTFVPNIANQFIVIGRKIN
jgi:DNA modification methylase